MRVQKLFCVVGTLGAIYVGNLAALKAQEQVNPTQQRQPTNLSANVQGGFSGGIQQSPWFSNPAIRQQMQLNDEQFSKLNSAYMQSWNRYNEGVAGIDPKLAEDQRRQRQQELSSSFYKDFSSTANGVLTDPASRQRFNQLAWQYRGIDAFADPALQQQLKLTDEQRQAFSAYQNEWNQQMNTWRRDWATDRAGVAQKYGEARKQWQDRINSTLTPEQRKLWPDLIGQPYDFPADSYFPGSNTRSTLKPTAK